MYTMLLNPQNNKNMKKVILTAVMVVISLFQIQAAMTIASDSDSVVTVNTVAEDSIKFKSALPSMLALVAHFEAVRVDAYWDNAAKVWTIGIGNTVRPDGRRVSAKDRISSKEELLKYFSVHVWKYIWKDVENYLKIEKMSAQEIAAVGSLCYNCGSAILKNSDKSPSALACAINDFIETRSDEARAKVKALMDRRVTAKGKPFDVLVKRRAVEELVLFGEITMVDNDEYAIENAVNFAEVPIGASYGIKIGELGDVTHVTDSINNCHYGRNLQDSIDYAFKHPNVQRKVVKPAAKKPAGKRPVRR